MLGSAGVTAIEVSVAVVIVREVDPEMEPIVAMMVVSPAASPVTLPLVPVALLAVANDVTDELQVADVVRSWVVPFEYVPIAENCSVVPAAMLPLTGVTAMDLSIALVTGRVVEPVMVPNVAVIVVGPAATALARPPLAVMVALEVSEELQVTCVVRSWDVLSENVPVALNCCVVPAATLWLTGVTVIDLSVTSLTGRVVVPETSPDVAVIVGVPGAMAVALPLESTAIIELSEELQVTCVVRSWVVLSENVPVALSCCVVPAATL